MNIAIIGYGRMGHAIERIAVERGHSVCSIIDVDNIADMDGEGFAQADVVIEFTTPQSAYDNVKQCFARAKKVVCGSTGWIDSYIDEMRRLCNDGQTLFWSSNFSVGVALFRAVNRYAAQLMNRFEQYAVSVEETHHIHKLDAPSGTAITLTEDILHHIERKSKWQLAGNGRADNADTIPVAAIRRAETPGTHTIHYDSHVDTITLSHQAHSRDGLALGAVLAAEYTHRHQGWLTMEEMMDDRS